MAKDQPKRGARAADVVTRETFGSALIMGEEALKLLGYDDEELGNDFNFCRQL